MLRYFLILICFVPRAELLAQSDFEAQNSEWIRWNSSLIENGIGYQCDKAWEPAGDVLQLKYDTCRKGGLCRTLIESTSIKNDQEQSYSGVTIVCEDYFGDAQKLPGADDGWSMRNLLTKNDAKFEKRYAKALEGEVLSSKTNPYHLLGYIKTGNFTLSIEGDKFHLKFDKNEIPISVVSGGSFIKNATIQFQDSTPFPSSVELEIHRSGSDKSYIARYNFEVPQLTNDIQYPGKITVAVLLGDGTASKIVYQISNVRGWTADDKKSCRLPYYGIPDPFSNVRASKWWWLLYGGIGVALLYASVVFKKKIKHSSS